MALTREAQNELARRAAALGALGKHPSWPELMEELERKKKRLAKTATNLALAATGPDVQRLSEIRGSIAMLNWFGGVPIKAEDSLAKFLAEQMETEEEDDE